jgi:hypothetical protein
VSFSQTDPQNHQSENTWFTPKVFFDVLGGFDLDPCTMSFRPFDVATVHIERDKGECGLRTEWSGDVWLNPPYGKEIKPFIDKFIKHKKGVLLIFARMGSQSVQDLIKAGAYFYFLRRRVKFINKNGQMDSNAGTDSCLVFFEEKWIEKVSKLEGVLK